MFLVRVVLLGALMAVAPVATAYAETRVVASIKPIHSLVAGVMAGVGSPTLIVEGAGSPHTFSLKPSHAAQMESADVIFWVGHGLEPFLEKPLELLGAKARVVELMDTKGLIQLAVREGGAFEGHDHSHGHDDDHGHAEESHDDHGHGEAKHDDHGNADKAHHDEHDGYADGAANPHIWLDPMNAKLMIGEIARNLAKADLANAAIYRANADAMMAQINSMSEKVSQALETVRERPFVVFHDAYQHFETRYGLKAVGSITVSPEVVPGAARVQEIQERIRGLGAVCVFSEPQFTPKLVSVVTEGSAANHGVLDPLGAELSPGPDLYVTLIENLAGNMAACLIARS